MERSNVSIVMPNTGANYEREGILTEKGVDLVVLSAANYQNFLRSGLILPNGRKIPNIILPFGYSDSRRVDDLSFLYPICGSGMGCVLDEGGLVKNFRLSSDKEWRELLKCEVPEGKNYHELEKEFLNSYLVSWIEKNTIR